ncbi:hypothetical protein PV341_08385 [Streptomyces sp. PA03-1a]|nr:hypothetical protein [Streptomyces sp. PA03-1a]
MTGIRRLLSRRLQTRQLQGVAPGPHEFTVQRTIRVPMGDGVELIAVLCTPISEVDPATAHDRHLLPVRPPERVFALAHAVVARWWEQALPWEREGVWPRRLPRCGRRRRG